jgi:hypothetical protein
MSAKIIIRHPQSKMIAKTHKFKIFRSRKTEMLNRIAKI